jgi:tetratricopeptide (TPR) repeat protein
MRNKLKSTLLFVGICAFATLPARAQVFDVDSLKFTIGLDKEEYLLNEPIWITVKLENISQKEVFAGSLDPVRSFLQFYVVSLNGDTLQGGCIMGNVPGPKYPTLDPGEMDIVFIDLIGPVCTYGVEHEDALYWRRIPEGEYTLQAKVNDFYHKNLNERKHIFSNKLTFRVEIPSGKEKRVYDLLVKGEKEFRKKRLEAATDYFLEILNKYPKSVYVDAIYPGLDYLYSMGLKRVYKRENRYSIAQRYLNNYPNSGIVAYCIDALRPGPGKTAERKKFYEDIIKKYPNTKATMYAENQLDKWRRGKIWVNEPIK